MDKHRTHHYLVLLRKLRYSYFVVALVVFGLVFIFSYRQNNVTALKLRDQVLVADKTNGDVKTALNDLRAFTYAHMNANLSGGSGNIYPPIQLKYRYERLVQAENDRVAAANKQIYTDAQAACEAQISSGRVINRVPCIDAYVAAHGTVTAKSIPDALYKFDFSSPIWSPDLAGWSLVGLIIVAFLFLVRAATGLWLRQYLSR